MFTSSVHHHTILDLLFDSVEPGRVGGHEDGMELLVQKFFSSWTVVIASVV